MVIGRGGLPHGTSPLGLSAAPGRLSGPGTGVTRIGMIEICALFQQRCFW